MSAEKGTVWHRFEICVPNFILFLTQRILIDLGVRFVHIGVKVYEPPNVVKRPVELDAFQKPEEEDDEAAGVS